jgi:hypothetical protein
MFNSIKYKYGHLVLSKKKRKIKRERSIFNLSTAKTCGLVFNATNQSTFEKAKAFVDFLKSKNIKVTAIGFVESKEVKDFYRETIQYKYFSKKNTNWYGKPKNTNVNDFVKVNFDILIDLSLTNDFPLEYISALSLAKFKVGRFTSENADYDFMIDISKNNTHDYLIEQISHYLSILNNNDK